MKYGRHPELEVYRDYPVKLLNLDWDGVIEVFTEAAFELPRVEAPFDGQLDDVANIQLALTELRESPGSEARLANCHACFLETTGRALSVPPMTVNTRLCC